MNLGLATFHFYGRIVVGYFISWHSADDFDGLNMLGVDFKVEAVTRGEKCTKKMEEEQRVTVDKGEGERQKGKKITKLIRNEEEKKVFSRWFSFYLTAKLSVSSTCSLLLHYMVLELIDLLCTM